MDHCSEALHIPKEFDWDDDFKTPQVHTQLVRWKDISVQALRKIADTLDASQNTVHLTYLVASFAYPEKWCSEAHQGIALDYLNSLGALDLTAILTDHIKPLFITTPHPMLNSETGRKLPRPAGGVHSTSDLYDNQLWKANIGVASVLRFCVERLSTSDLELRWPLIIPPIVTLADDREGKWRLRVLPIISALLDKAPADLLCRTGLQGLLQTSLNNTLLFTGNPESAMLIEQATPVLLKLIVKTTKHGTEERFDSLRNLLGKSIIGSLWLYNTKDVESMRATYHVLPSILDVFGIGSVIYLKAMIPQLAFHICPQPFEAEDHLLVAVALEALLSIIRHCSPRIHRWRWSILECVCKRWVSMEDLSKNKGKFVSQSQNLSVDNTRIKALLRTVCRTLKEHCPGIREHEYDRIIMLDPVLFENLFSS